LMRRAPVRMLGVGYIHPLVEARDNFSCQRPRRFAPPFEPGVGTGEEPTRRTTARREKLLLEKAEKTECGWIWDDR